MIVTPRIVFRLVLIVLISVLLQIGFFSLVPLLGSVANLLPVVVVAIGLAVRAIVDLRPAAPAHDALAIAE